MLRRRNLFLGLALLAFMVKPSDAALFTLASCVNGFGAEIACPAGFSGNVQINITDTAASSNDVAITIANQLGTGYIMSVLLANDAVASNFGSISFPNYTVTSGTVGTPGQGAGNVTIGGIQYDWNISFLACCASEPSAFGPGEAVAFDLHNVFGAAGTIRNLNAGDFSTLLVSIQTIGPGGARTDYAKLVPTQVPEPTALTLLGIGLLLTRRVWRRISANAP